MLNRHGHSLPEALCALALGGVLAAAAGAALLTARRALASTELTTRGGRAEREAVAVVRQALEAGAAAVARGDTAVELDLLLGAAVVCATEQGAVVVPGPASPGLTALPQLPSAGDLAAVRDHAAASGDWWYGVVDSVQTRRGAAPCTAADGWRSGPDTSAYWLRVVVADTLPQAFEPGAELRLYRRGRFALYHLGRGEWALGWRRCHPFTGACGPIQPIAGPLVAPGAGGFRIRAGAAPERWEIAARGVGGRGAQGLVLPW